MGVQRLPGAGTGAQQRYALLVLDPSAKREVLHASLENGQAGRCAKWKVRLSHRKLACLLLQVMLAL